MDGLTFQGRRTFAQQTLTKKKSADRTHLLKASRQAFEHFALPYVRNNRMLSVSIHVLLKREWNANPELHPQKGPMTMPHVHSLHADSVGLHVLLEPRAASFCTKEMCKHNREHDNRARRLFSDSHTSTATNARCLGGISRSANLARQPRPMNDLSAREPNALQPMNGSYKRITLRPGIRNWPENQTASSGGDC